MSFDYSIFEAAPDPVKGLETLKKELEERKEKQDIQNIMILEYLVKAAEKDTLLAAAASQGWKSFEKCCHYLSNKAWQTLSKEKQKACSRNNPMATAIRDDQVYTWAEEYYRLDDKLEELTKMKDAEAKEKAEAKKKADAKKKAKEKALEDVKRYLGILWDSEKEEPAGACSRFMYGQLMDALKLLPDGDEKTKAKEIADKVDQHLKAKEEKEKAEREAKAKAKAEKEAKKKEREAAKAEKEAAKKAREEAKKKKAEEDAMFSQTSLFDFLASPLA